MAHHPKIVQHKDNLRHICCVFASEELHPSGVVSVTCEKTQDTCLTQTSDVQAFNQKHGDQDGI